MIGLEELHAILEINRCCVPPQHFCPTAKLRTRSNKYPTGELACTQGPGGYPTFFRVATRISLHTPQRKFRRQVRARQDSGMAPMAPSGQLPLWHGIQELIGLMIHTLIFPGSHQTSRLAEKCIMPSQTHPAFWNSRSCCAGPVRPIAQPDMNALPGAVTAGPIIPEPPFLACLLTSQILVWACSYIIRKATYECR
jgi:hypothetical protein